MLKFQSWIYFFNIKPQHNKIGEKSGSRIFWTFLDDPLFHSPHLVNHVSTDHCQFIDFAERIQKIDALAVASSVFFMLC